MNMHPQTTLKKLYPWFIWLLASSFLFYKYLLQVSPSVMVPDLMQTFGLTGVALGNLAAFYFYAYLSMQLPVGILLDKYNPRRLISAAIIVCALGAVVFARSQDITTAELGRLLIGIGGAFSAVGTMKLISLWFPAKRFALVSGLMMTIGMLGAVGGEAPLSYLIDNVGWREAMMISAIIGLVLALAILTLIKDRKANDDKTENMTWKKLEKNLLCIIKNKQSWLISFYSGLAFAPVSAFAGLWGVPYLMTKYAMGRELTASLVSLVFIGFAIGSPFAGWLSDRIQRRKPIMIYGTSASLIALSIVLYLPNLSIFALGAMLLIFGFFAGFFFVSFATIREINPNKMSGTSIGFINMFNAIFGALSEPSIGKLLDLGWDHRVVAGMRVFSVGDYYHALLLLPAVMVIALLLQFFIKETYCQSAS